MSYMSLAYYGIVLISLLIYYIFPAKYRWCVILVTSLFLYLNFSSFNRKKVALFLLTALLSYIFGLLLQQMKRSKVNPVITRIALIMSVLIVLLPLAYAKAVGIITPFIGEDRSFSVISYSIRLPEMSTSLLRLSSARSRSATAWITLAHIT